MAEGKDRRVRVATVAAATAISLACGTNYVFSAWAPSFAHRLHLTASQINTIGVCGNLGMYATGLPGGLLIDRYGPRTGVFLGAILLACGYFPLRSAYELGPDGMPVWLMSFCSYLTGLGSCIAFNAAVKTSTYNWPNHRGTASAFPLSGFGLSAFFFAAMSNLVFGHDISGFLLLMAVGTCLLNLASIPFTRLMPSQTVYESLPTSERPLRAYSPLPSPGGKARKKALSVDGAMPFSGASSPSRRERSPLPYQPESASPRNSDVGDDTHPLQSAASAADEEEEEEISGDQLHDEADTKTAEIKGLRVLYTTEFWQLFGMLSLLAGVGLMTINNIGNDTKALWRHWRIGVTDEFIQSQQAINVSLLSLCSCLGRFLSGVGSDILVKKLQASRFWCLFASASIFAIAQIIAQTVTDPNLLFLLASLNGLAYGALFGVFPALVADAFGASGMSTNWGIMIFAPVISSAIFNRIYGSVYDDHSHYMNNGKLDCPDGIDCYNLAYRYTLVASLAGIGLSIYCIRYEQAKKMMNGRVGERPD